MGKKEGNSPKCLLVLLNIEKQVLKCCSCVYICEARGHTLLRSHGRRCSRGSCGSCGSCGRYCRFIFLQLIFALTFYLFFWQTMTNLLFPKNTEAGEQNEIPEAENTFQNTTLVSVSGEELNPIMSYFSYLPSSNY